MAFKDFLKNYAQITSQAGFVDFGYGQVEPNHLSAQRTGQIYAQLPAAPSINVLEQGQFVKYDYAANSNGIGEVNFTGAGEWMLVFNEIKLYHTHPDGTKQWDCEFAMLKDDYQARVYSPYDYEHTENEYHTRWMNGADASGATSYTVNTNVTLNVDGKTVTIDSVVYDVTENKFSYNGTEYTLVDGQVVVPVVYKYDDVTKDTLDYYDFNATNDPFTQLGLAHEKKMPAGTSMVPRVFKTNVGDIFTTNTIKDTSVAVGNILVPGTTGILEVKASPAATDMQWQVVKVYTMPDGQKGAKLMRIA